MELDNRKKLLHKYHENPSMSHSMIAKATGTAKSTVTSVLKRFKDMLTVNRAKGGGRKPGPVNKELAKKIVRSAQQNPALSDRDRAKRFGTSRETARRTRLQVGLTSYRAIKVQNRADKQNLNAKQRARKLYDNVLTKFDGCLMMDDETYAKVDP